MAVSTRSAFEWRCEQCGSDCTEPVWRIIDARERADILTAGAQGVSTAKCPVCGALAYIEVPALVINPGTSTPLLLALSFVDLDDHLEQVGKQLLAEAQKAGAFASRPVLDLAIPVPRRLLAVVLTRDVERDLRDPEAACRELQIIGPPAVPTNYRTFLGYVAAERQRSEIKGLLYRVTGAMPDELAELIRVHPELTEKPDVRDLGRAEVLASIGTELEPILRRRQQLLEALYGGDLPVAAAIQQYVEAAERHGQSLRGHAYALHRQVMESNGVESLPLAREALAFASRIGEARLEIELSATLGIRLIEAVQRGQLSDLSEATRVLSIAVSRLPEGSLLWAEVASNLANALYRSQNGDRFENWDTACSLLARAAQIDRGAHPEFWARIQTSYGLILAERPGDGAQDLTLGISHIEAGLEERSPERNKVDWAYSMLNLGLLCSRRNTPGDLPRAAECYSDALKSLRAEDDPVLWSQLISNLAALLLKRKDKEDARLAKKMLTRALNFALKYPGLLDPVRTKWLLAQAIDQLEGGKSRDSLRLRTEALAATSPRVAPSLHLRIAGELVEQHARASRWPQAAEAASGMVVAVAALFDAQVTIVGRRSVLSEASRVSRWAAYLLARAGHAERAVEAIEAGLACELSVVVGRAAVDLRVLDGLDPIVADKYRQAQTRYQSSITEPATPMAGSLVAHDPVEQGAAERALRTVINEIRTIPGFDGFLRASRIEDISRAAGGVPLAYLVNAPWGSYVLTVCPSTAEGQAGLTGPTDNQPNANMPIVQAISVPEVSSELIVQRMVVDANGSPGLLFAQHATDLKRQRLLPEALAKLADLGPLLRPVAHLLAETASQEITLIPTGLLGLVPLHAIPVERDSNVVLDDLGTVNVAPSAATFGASRSRAARSQDGSLRFVAVVDPDGSLPGSHTELSEILELFTPPAQVTVATGAQATVEWTLGHLSAASYVHIGCHGNAEMFGQHGGSLAMADGRLDMDTITKHQLPSCRLVVASACMSGRYGTIHAPDEFRGLPTGFLAAGAACAVVSLWPVNDLATALLMTRFYQYVIADGMAPVHALRHARVWLRDLTSEKLQGYILGHPHLSALVGRYEHWLADKPQPFSAPVHWSPFTAWGA
ncbi:CHAT domain-containing protein [Nocardia niigatensis]